MKKHNKLGVGGGGENRPFKDIKYFKLNFRTVKGTVVSIPNIRHPKKKASIKKYQVTTNIFFRKGSLSLKKKKKQI